MQYPEKSDQWNARYDMASQLSGITLVGFFRLLRHILEPEFGETGIRVGVGQLTILPQVRVQDGVNKILPTLTLAQSPVNR